MAHAAFDTLEFVDELEKSGIPEKQARALAAAVRKAHESSDLATKADLRELELHPWCLKHFSDSRRHLPEAFLNKGKALSGDKRCLRSTSRMMLGMQRRQALAGNMRIDLGRRNIGMPQQKLHGAQISAVVQ